jgi:hypothetical protein
MRALADTVRAVSMTVFAALREIFDESAYQRFLTRNAVRSSREAWSAFAQEQASRKERRARCC